MKRALAIAVLVLALVAGATVAEAAISKGRFAGKTSAGDPIGLKVDRKGRVYAFYFDGVRLECTDGDSFDTPKGGDRIQTPDSVKFRVSDKRRWGIRDREDNQGWDARGRFNRAGTKVTGTFHVFATFDENSQPDPNGSVRCESAKLDWSATRK